MATKPVIARGRALPLMLEESVCGSQTSLLVASLESAIREGRLAPGSRVPPTRDAAHQLQLGRNTIVDAYAELVARGLLEPRGRAGTFVANRGVGLRLGSTQSPIVVSRLTLESATSPTGSHDWRLGQSGTQLLPIETWRAACREAGRHLPPAGYGDPEGYAPLRAAIATWLNSHRGTRHQANNIVITQGAGAALDLLAQALIRPGDLCAVENPGYVRARTAFAAAGGTIISVPVDEQGIVVSRAFANPPAVIHLTPAHQYPIGVRLSGARRAELSDVLTRHGTLLIENEYDHEFIYEGQNHTAMAASMPEQTALVSTFAKAISPALRIGFVAAPLPVVYALSAVIRREKLQATWPAQISVHWLLSTGELQRHLRRARRHHQQQRDQLVKKIQHACPQVRISGQDGGLHIVLSLRSEDLDRRLAAELRSKGVVLQSAADFGDCGPDLLMGYGHMSHQELESAVELLRSACNLVISHT
jgi:GntR family transcriptional regulator/MocR family aminotransferase